jgi:hypothetical protein
MDPQEKRNFSRVSFTADASIEYGGILYAGRIVDIALKGALLEFDKPIPISKGDKVELSIHLHGTDLVLSFGTTVAHIEGNSGGFSFSTADVESLTHLRRLLELNIGDPDLVSQELSNWLE